MKMGFVIVVIALCAGWRNDHQRLAESLDAYHAAIDLSVSNTDRALALLRQCEPATKDETPL